MGWWLFTALTHLVFEPPFLFTPDFFSKENPNYFDDLCELISSHHTRSLRATANWPVAAFEISLYYIWWRIDRCLAI